MKLALRGLLALLALAVLWYVSQAVASESGEVVVLTTYADVDATHTTRLWVVDHDGNAWLRAGSAESSWFQRLTARPDVEVERNGVTASYTAMPEPEKRDEINGRMQEKYGWADSYIGFWFGRDDSIPVRLVPR
jgi:hypothetical protein